MTKTLICAALLALSTAAYANSEPRTLLVRTGDLDLTSAKDLTMLDRRVHAAARALCRSGTRGVAAVAAENACYESSVERTRPQVRLAIARAHAAAPRLAAASADAAVPGV